MEFNVFESIKIGLASPEKIREGLMVRLKNRKPSLQNPETRT